MVYRRGLSFRR